MCLSTGGNSKHERGRRWECVCQGESTSAGQPDLSLTSVIAPEWLSCKPSPVKHLLPYLFLSPFLLSVFPDSGFLLVLSHSYLCSIFKNNLHSLINSCVFCNLWCSLSSCSSAASPWVKFSHWSLSSELSVLTFESDVWVWIQVHQQQYTVYWTTYDRTFGWSQAVFAFFSSH